jgi:hypothetical protein
MLVIFYMSNALIIDTKGCALDSIPIPTQDVLATCETCVPAPIAFIALL